MGVALPSGREVVVGRVNDFRLEDVASLLSDAFAKQVVLRVHQRDVALVARDHRRLLRARALIQNQSITHQYLACLLWLKKIPPRRPTDIFCKQIAGKEEASGSNRRDDVTYLVSHVIVGGSVEVGVGPAGELIFVVLLSAAVVLEGELGVRLKELGCGNHLLLN